VKIARIAFLVVCGVDAVMDTLRSQTVFTHVDFPDDGRPMMATVAHFMG
jgi:hypothetical protein